MQLKDLTVRGGKLSAKDSTKLGARQQKEFKKLQQDLQQEKVKFSQMAANYQKENQELRALLYEETQATERLRMEMDAKDAEVEMWARKAMMSSAGSDTASVNSMDTADNRALDASIADSLLLVPGSASLGRGMF